MLSTRDPAVSRYNLYLRPFEHFVDERTMNVLDWSCKVFRGERQRTPPSLTPLI